MGLPWVILGESMAFKQLTGHFHSPPVRSRATTCCFLESKTVPGPSPHPRAYVVMNWTLCFFSTDSRGNSESESEFTQSCLTL